MIPVVEEELQVGKRQVQRGGVRIHSHVTERPVEEQVTLRDETVNVERRPVDRSVGDVGPDAFKERNFEVSETDEEAVVSKQARVIEEVVIGKDVEEHTQNVRDTVRRTDVDVEKLGTERTGTTRTTDTTGTGFDDTYYRNYYNNNLKNSGYTYDQYSPVFRYGEALGTSDRYRGKDWSAVEPDARREWENRNPGTWEEFKGSIRHAWQHVTGKR